MATFIEGQIALVIRDGLTNTDRFIPEIVLEIIEVCLVCFICQVVTLGIQDRVTAVMNHGFIGQMQEQAAVSIFYRFAGFIINLFAAQIANHIALEMQHRCSRPVYQWVTDLM